MGSGPLSEEAQKKDESTTCTTYTLTDGIRCVGQRCIASFSHKRFLLACPRFIAPPISAPPTPSIVSYRDFHERRRTRSRPLRPQPRLPRSGSTCSGPSSVQSYPTTPFLPLSSVHHHASARAHRVPSPASSSSSSAQRR